MGCRAHTAAIAMLAHCLVVANQWHDAAGAAHGAPYPFNDPSLPTDERVADLLGRMTLAEKVGQLFMDAKVPNGGGGAVGGGDLPSTAIPRLGVPGFNWMSQGNVYRGAANGCSIGCCSCVNASTPGVCCVDGHATQFPQGTGVAATFNPRLVFEMGVVASNESRALMNFPGRHADYRTGASSVINILRDGRWGRAPETYGECPELTGAMAVALNKALIGFDSLDAANRTARWIKVLPTVRHFIAYAGPDSKRFDFNAVVSDVDLEFTFLPAWKRLADAGALGGVMSAISALNGVPSAAHKRLLTDVLRGEWGWDGHVISDCDTITAMSTQFHYTATVPEAAAAAVVAGGDINCGPEYELLLNASVSGLVSEQTIDTAVTRALRRRVQVGDLDPPGLDPWADIPLSSVASDAHAAVAREVVAESVVLLSNNNAALPLVLPSSGNAGGSNRGRGGSSGGTARTLAVIGPSADDIAVQAHTYHGTPKQWVTVLDAVRSAASSSSGGNATVTFAAGCTRTGSDKSGIAEATKAASAADAVVYVGGLQASMEEEGTDRSSLTLPGVQLDLIQALRSAAGNKPLVVVIVSGGPVAEPVLHTLNHTAVLWLSYFGQAGDGVADVIFGAHNPSGRLPFTVPLNAGQLPDIEDYAMTSGNGRTYRYLDFDKAAPLHRFASGMSYSNFTVDALTVNASGDSRRSAEQRQIVSNSNVAAASVTLRSVVNLTATVANHGPLDGKFVAALFAQSLTLQGAPSPVTELPRMQLVAFDKVNTTAGAATTVRFSLTVASVPGIERQPLPGLLRLWVGDGGPCAAGSPACAAVTVNVSDGL